MGRLGQWNENRVIFFAQTSPQMFAHDHIGQAGHGRRLGTNSVATTSITNLAVTTGKINNLAVTSGKLGGSAVLRSKIADSALHRRKLGSGVPRWGRTPGAYRAKVYWRRRATAAGTTTIGTSIHGMATVTAFFGFLVSANAVMPATARNIGASQLNATQVRFRITGLPLTYNLLYCICGRGGA